MDDDTGDDRPAEPARTPPSIGMITMQPDGTIVLQLRAVGPGMIGDALRVYAPGHPRYQPTIDHVGGLAPGERKPIPPWP